MGKVARFLKTDEAREAAGRSGYSCIEDFQPDDHPQRIGVSMRGWYTVDELKGKLADLEYVQAAFDKWCRTAPVAEVEGDTFFERNAGRVHALALGVEPEDRS